MISDFPSCIFDHLSSENLEVYQINADPWLIMFCIFVASLLDHKSIL